MNWYCSGYLIVLVLLKGELSRSLRYEQLVLHVLATWNFDFSALQQIQTILLLPTNLIRILLNRLFWIRWYIMQMQRSCQSWLYEDAVIIELIMIVLLVNEAQSVLVGPIHNITWICICIHGCIIFECTQIAITYMRCPDNKSSNITFRSNPMCSYIKYNASDNLYSSSYV
jgi:hypothetical protein